MNIEQVTAQARPVVAFSVEAKDIRELGALPRWVGITSEDWGDRIRDAVDAFNRGELDGIAFTYAAGCMGFRLRGARTLAIIGSAPINAMSQAAARAPGAKTVLL